MIEGHFPSIPIIFECIQQTVACRIWQLFLKAALGSNGVCKALLCITEWQNTVGFISMCWIAPFVMSFSDTNRLASLIILKNFNTLPISSISPKDNLSVAMKYLHY